jgi:uncharacterized radical SAM superfamily protein
VPHPAAVDAPRWQQAWAVRLAHHPATIYFDRPSQTLPVSLTGSHCALRCAHCGGHYLGHMRAIGDVDASAPRSLLISGGCDREGRLPLTQHAEAVAALRPGRRLNWHVGARIAAADLEAVLPLIDVVSFDVVGDSATAREVYGLDLSLDHYMDTLAMLRSHVPVVPHLTIGLRGGRISGEHRALAALAALEPTLEALILIVLIPTPDTAFAACQPPSEVEVADLFVEARLALPHTRLFLGCMRPYGGYRQIIDQAAVRAGLNGIVNPTRAAESLAVEQGLEIVWGEECCALEHL